MIQITHQTAYKLGQDTMLTYINEAVEAAERGKPLSKLRSSCNPKIAELQEKIYLVFLGEEHDTRLKPYQEK